MDILSDIFKKDDSEKTINICSKEFPIDLFGTLDEASQDFGLFNVKAPIVCENGSNMTYLKFAEEVLKCLNISSNESNLKDISSDEIKYFLRCEFEDLANTYLYRSDSNPLNKFSSIDFNRIIAEYLVFLNKKDFDSLETEVFRNLNVGLYKGILYIPTGYDITFTYYPSERKFHLAKCPIDLENELIELSESDDYKNDIISFIGKHGSSFSNNVKKFLIFPYFPTAEMYVENNINDLNKYNEFGESFVYKIDKYYSSIIKDPDLSNSVDVKFSIYRKKTITCGFNKCRIPDNETKDTNGVCGLDEFLRTPGVFDLCEFEFVKESNKRLSNISSYSLKKDVNDFCENMNKLSAAARDDYRLINLFRNVKNELKSDITDFSNKNGSLLNTLPVNNLSDDGKTDVSKIVVDKIENKSVIEEADITYRHVMNLASLLNEDLINNSSKSLVSLMTSTKYRDFLLTQFLNENLDKSINFNRCPLRFKDYIDNKHNLKSLHKGLLELEKEEVSRIYTAEVLKKLASDKISSKLTNVISNDSTISNKIVKSIAEGDSEALNAAMAESSQSRKTTASSVQNPEISSISYTVPSTAKSEVNVESAIVNSTASNNNASSGQNVSSNSASTSSSTTSNTQVIIPTVYKEYSNTNVDIPTLFQSGNDIYGVLRSMNISVDSNTFSNFRNAISNSFDISNLNNNAAFRNMISSSAAKDFGSLGGMDFLIKSLATGKTSGREILTEMLNGKSVAGIKLSDALNSDSVSDLLKKSINIQSIATSLAFDANEKQKTNTALKNVTGSLLKKTEDSKMKEDVDEILESGSTVESDAFTELYTYSCNLDKFYKELGYAD